MVSSMVPIFKNVGERSTHETYGPVSIRSVVREIFEKLLNDRLVEHLE